jgi:dipeptidyl-peptidase-4
MKSTTFAHLHIYAFTHLTYIWHMKKILLLLLITVNTAFAQQKLFSMEEAVFSSKTAVQSLKALQWLPDGTRYSYNGKKNGDECLIISSVKSSKNDTVLTSRELYANNKTFPVYTWLSNDEILFLVNKDVISFNIKTKKESKRMLMQEKSANHHFNNNNTAIAYTVNNNLYYSTPSKTIAITNDSNDAVVYGQAVHRNEFGIFDGIFWSPNDELIAFYRMDQSMVSDYPLVDINSSPAKLNAIKYPMAGQASHEVSVGVYNINTNKTIYLKVTGAKDQYLTNITWSPDARYVYVAVVTRSYQDMQLNQYDANTGELLKTLFTEHDEKYVEPNKPMHFLKNGNFIWHSERDGFKHLYLYSYDGKLIKQLTKGAWVVTDFYGVDESNKVAYYQSTQRSALDRDLYKVELSSGKITQLSKVDGVHTISMNNAKTLYIDNYSNTRTPCIINIYNTKGQEQKKLLNAPNPIADYTLGSMEISTIKAADGKTDLYTRIFKPINFDANKKYPVVLYVYGGPHIQLIKNNWLGGANLWFQLMAQKGYVVYTVESRGSMFRGKEFEQSTFRQLGTVEFADQLKGIEFLKTQSFVDTNRIGVHGWSYGGFMTTMLMSRAANVFKVGVAGGPVIDWSLYEIMYTERYMDSPAENPEGYKANNLLNYVEGLKGRLMMIHGADDDVVVWQHSLAYIKKCVDKGVLIDYFAYPGHQHNVRGKDRIHLMNTITRYFEDHL